MRLIAIPTGMPGGFPLPPPGDAVRRSLGGETMGTMWSVDYFAPAEGGAEALREEIGAELERLNGQMSHWREESELSRFNRAAAGEWRRLPEEFFEVLRFGLHVARKSGGAFDPALGAVVEAWGFGPRGKPGLLPGRGATWRDIAIRVETREARQPGGAELDFSAIAKGYAVDRVAALLEARGVGSFLVEIGGELRGRGIKDNRQPWWVKVEGPPEGFGGEIVVALHNASIATTGDYRRYFERDGVRFAHTIHPHTAAPARNGVASVSVIHESTMAADAYSTALAVLGEEDGLAMADRLRLAAVYLMREGERCVVRYSEAFGEMLDVDGG